MNRKQLAVLLTAIFVSIAVFGALQYAQNQKSEETAGRAVFHLINNEYYQLIRLERYVRQGEGAQADAQMDLLTALVFFAVAPGGEMPWANLYYGLEADVHAAFDPSAQTAADSTAKSQTEAREEALNSIRSLLALQDQVRALCGPGEDADSEQAYDEAWENYLALTKPGSGLRTQVEGMVHETFGDLPSPLD